MPAEIFLPLSLACAAIVLLQYYRANRVAGGIGWVLLIFAIGAFGSGLASSFTWAGLLFGSIGGLGVIIVLQELAFRRHDLRRRDRSSADPLPRRK